MMRLGVVGTGWITDRLIDAASHEPNVQITAVCSRSLQSATKFASKYQITDVFDSVEAMCESGKIDAVYIATPNSQHAKYAISCMTRKIHCLVEKPLAANAEEARAMVSCAKQNQVILMEAMRVTINPVMDFVREKMQQIGPIHKFIANFDQFSSKFKRFEAGENFSSFSDEFAGGAMMDIGVYPVWAMVSLFGRPQLIKAAGTLFRTKVDREASVVCQYQDMTAIINVSKVTDSDLPTEIQGEDGRVIIEKLANMAQATLVLRGQSDTAQIKGALENDMAYEVMDFYQIWKDGKLESTFNTLENSVIVMEILDEIRNQLGVDTHSKDFP